MRRVLRVVVVLEALFLSTPPSSKALAPLTSMVVMAECRRVEVEVVV